MTDLDKIKEMLERANIEYEFKSHMYEEEVLVYTAFGGGVEFNFDKQEGYLIDLLDFEP